jgi:hypothetical protein
MTRIYMFLPKSTKGNEESTVCFTCSATPSGEDAEKSPRLDPYDAPSNGSPIFSNESVDYGHKHSDGFRRSSDNISIDIDEEQGGFCSDGDDSQSTASARFPIGTNPRADDAGSDSDVSFYESVDADLPSTAVSDDQVCATNQASSPISNLSLYIYRRTQTCHQLWLQIIRFVLPIELRLLSQN